MIDYESRNNFRKELSQKTNEELLRDVKDYTRKSRELLTSLTLYETSEDYSIIKELTNVEYYRTATIDYIIGGAI